MSFTKRLFYFVRSADNFSQNSYLRRCVMLAFTFFLVLGFFMNSYTTSAQQGFQYDIQEVYVETDKVSSYSSGVEGKHSHKAQGFQMTDFFGNMLDLTYPQANANYSDMLASQEISVGSKLGLIGVIDVPVSAMLYNPPYVDIPEHLAQEWIPNYEGGRSAIYAQSSLGYAQLSASGITGLWNVTRNIAYMLFVIVFIVAGFMIMFRHKIQGQTMVTVYNTLPGIIVGLILVTFSFAIVGFIIDIGAVLIRVIDGILDLGDLRVDGTHPFSVMGSYSKYVFGQGGTFLIETFTGNVLDLVANLLFNVMKSLIGLLIMLIAVGIIAYASIRIFFTLIRAYIAILFDTIMAPIVFAIATIPGRSGVMKDWFNRVVKNVLVFVLVFLLINLPLYFMENGYQFDLFAGDLGTGDEGLGPMPMMIVMIGVAIYLLFLAGNVPKLLEDYFPQTGGKGAAGAAEGTKKDMTKVPLVGGFFKG